MAERRMFAKAIIDSDAFLDMPLSTQALYFHLSMRADDEGFVGNPKKIQRMIGASDDDCRILTSKRFILTFQSGIIVIKHWRIHNYIRGDRAHETTYLEEKSMLTTDKKGSYTEKEPDKCQSSGRYLSGKCHTEISIESGKDNIKERMNEDKEIRNYNARETYQSIMDDMCLESSVKPAMWEFIKHCQLNGKTLTNDKLTNILVEMDLQNLSPEEKSKVLLDAVNGGFFDIRRK